MLNPVGKAHETAVGQERDSSRQEQTALQFMRSPHKLVLRHGDSAEVLKTLAGRIGGFDRDLSALCRSKG